MSREQGGSTGAPVRMSNDPKCSGQTIQSPSMEPAESEAILDQLYEIGERREFIFEHVWKLGDFLMWDNRCTIHARTDFPKEERRLLRRCTVEGMPLHE